jgi:hypothetical protein
MRKIASVFMAMFSIFVLSANCFAWSDHAVIVTDQILINQIAQIMVKDKELSPNCIKINNGIPNEMITVSLQDFGLDNTEVYALWVETNAGACCKEGQKCGKWIYKKNDATGNFSKIFGPVYLDEVQVVNDFSYNGTVRGLRASYPAGNSYSSFNEYYRFDGKKYKFMRRVAGQ